LYATSINPPAPRLSGNSSIPSASEFIIGNDVGRLSIMLSWTAHDVWIFFYSNDSWLNVTFENCLWWFATDYDDWLCDNSLLWWLARSKGPNTKEATLTHSETLMMSAVLPRLNESWTIICLSYSACWSRRSKYREPTDSFDCIVLPSPELS
jgi:hypothetical protein